MTVVLIVPYSQDEQKIMKESQKVSSQLCHKNHGKNNIYNSICSYFIEVLILHDCTRVVRKVRGHL